MIFDMISFPSSSVAKKYACNAEDLGSIPGSQRSPGEGNSYPILCLEEPMGREAWWVIDHGSQGLKHFHFFSLGVRGVSLKFVPLRNKLV